MMKTIRDPKFNPHKNDTYRLADGRTIEVARRLKGADVGIFTTEDVIVYLEANGEEDGRGGRVSLSLFQALIGPGTVVRAKGVRDATKVRTVARVHFTRPAAVMVTEDGEERTQLFDDAAAYGNFHGYRAGVVVRSEADGSLSLYLAPCEDAPGALLRGVPADAVRFEELE